MGSNGILARGCGKIISDSSDSHYCKKIEACSKLFTYDWLKGLQLPPKTTDLVEIRFKNTRKGFYRNVNNLMLKQGDIVAVESSPGHDIGVVGLTGELVTEQIRRSRVPVENDIKKIYRKAKSLDIDKWRESIDMEEITMFKARKIAEQLRLNMKIGDVEYQGDRTKAIFYYIADERVDFRELIKMLADEFKIRIEMRQIGARQEAARIGGIGSCGRELCCSTFVVNFVSVTTNAARYQDVSLNPQKLAGQCSKLKCCLNYEVDAYLDAQKDFPDTSIVLYTFDGMLFHQKTDVFRRIMWYSPDKDNMMNMVALAVNKVHEIIETNKKGGKVTVQSEEKPVKTENVELGFHNVVGQESLTRFDKNRGNNNRNKQHHHKRNQNFKRNPRNEN